MMPLDEFNELEVAELALRKQAAVQVELRTLVRDLKAENSVLRVELAALEGHFAAPHLSVQELARLEATRRECINSDERRMHLRTLAAMMVRALDNSTAEGNPMIRDLLRLMNTHL